jgi:4-methyl-5(b-hydroxyethyl)-thiazole monophosphate biosynthesis
MSTVLVPLADGVEEMEAVIVIDVLRRAGCRVISAGIKTRTVTASRDTVLVADRLFSEVQIDAMDALVLPGGAGGTEALLADERVLAAAKRLYAAGRTVAAICAAPLVLQAAGLLEGHRFTSHPGVRERFTSGVRVDERVVVEGNLITSQGPGTAFDFALALVARLEGKPKANAVAAAMVM